MSGMPLEMQISVTFEDQGDEKTKMTLRHQDIPAGKNHDDAEAGWNESLDKLAEGLN